jgi:signal transduction histidine kinase
MNGRNEKLPDNRCCLAALDESERLLAAFLSASVIGIAVCDDQLRYLGINDALAAMNGVTAEAHMGNTVRDILGNAAAKPEPALKQVMASGQAVCFELTAMLPTRTELGCWIENYFPIKSGRGRAANQIATITVEVTAQRKLEKSFRKLTGELLWTGKKEHRWLARDLHDSIDEYHSALNMSLVRLTTGLAGLNEHSWEPDKSAEILAESIEWLDQRLANMRATVSAIAGQFPDQSTTQAAVM